uniref:CCDC113/CCDC96 coiled-coil domain-containing protein n=1 Tax=Zeugodacus cucurbitae TaxID=28588 RepID=A0A0A1XNR3_ZEUCU
MDLEMDFADEYENTESDFVPKHTDEPQQEVKHQSSHTSNRSGKRERQSFHSSKNTSDVFQGTGLAIGGSVETFNDEEYEGEDELNIEGTVAQLENTLRLSFLDKFADLPNIDDISSESVETIIEQQVEEKTIDIALTGKFVDPLTGLDLIESDKEDDEFDFVEIEESYEEPSYEGYEPFDITEDSELLLLQAQAISQETEEVDNALLDMDYIKKIMQAVDVQDIEQILADDTHLQNEEIVAGFIEDLFRQIVNVAHYKDPKDILRKSVDKRRIMDEIHGKVRTLESEQILRLYLNRKVVEHFKRKHMYRLITEDTAEDVEFLMAKYQSLLQKYNEILGKEEEIERVTKTKIDKLHVKLEEKQFQVEEKVSEFEALAYRIILPQRRDMYGGELNLKLFESTDNVERSKFITVFLKKMALTRKELSEARLILIKKQHIFADLQERLNQIQNIGDGLKLFQFENLQNDVIQLSKKTDGVYIKAFLLFDFR